MLTIFIRNQKTAESSAFTMSQARVFSLIGDSNLRRHLNSTNCRDRPLMSGSQQIPCGRIEVLAEALSTVREESTVLVLACVTNLLTSTSDESSSVSLRVEPVLQEFLSKILQFGSDSPDVHILICPPMYRRQPLWYREGLPEILTKFSAIMSPVPRVQLMPSFPTPSFENDGVHLTPYSGLEYVLHLFDSANALLNSSDLPLEDSVKKSVESSRVLEDRMVAIEQDHHRLNDAFEMKTAADAELAEFHQNVAFESFITIHGLARSATGLDPREWQNEAKKQVSALLARLMEHPVPVVYIKNSTSRRPGAETRYHVQLQSVEVSKKIRDKFSTFFPGGKDSRPPEYTGISIRNRLTQETRIRIAIMQLLAHRYRASNPGGKAAVLGFDSRPILKITPPSEDENDRRVQSYSYIEAVRKFPTNFTSEELTPILSMIGSEQKGRVRSLFVVINDDMIKRGRTPGTSGGAQGASGGTQERAETVTKGPESGGATGASGSSRSQKRGPSRSPSDASRKKNKSKCAK